MLNNNYEIAGHVRKCENYEPPLLASVLEKCLDDLGGMSSWLKEGIGYYLSRICSSPRPHEAVVTHPAVVEAIASMVIDAGPLLSSGTARLSQSPRFCRNAVRAFYEENGHPGGAFVEKLPVEFSTGRLFRRMDLLASVWNLTRSSIWQTEDPHQMVLTLAVKNSLEPLSH